MINPPAGNNTSSDVHKAPWENAFRRVLDPLQEFTGKQITSSLLLLACTITALILANTVFADHFLHLLHLPFSLAFGDRHFSLSLQHWINEALMGVFFLLVGLELKRELFVGELADLRRAALPIVAATGGMILPAAIYWAWNPAGATLAGWGIPMATDIAFAIGALSLLGQRVPPSLVTFLIALAIVDDLGAVLVIALFYTGQLNLQALLAVGVLTSILIAMNLGGIRRVIPYMLVGILLWCAMLHSGIHATLAGVILAFTIPVRPKYNAAHFLRELRSKTTLMENSLQDCPDILLNENLRSQVSALENGIELVQAPAQRLEHALHMPVAYVVIPLFALANAAIPLDFSTLGSTLSHPVALGIATGLLAGKWAGVTLSSWLALRSRLAVMPEGLTMRHIHGIGLLAGIGFTMSIFVADLAFHNDPSLLLMAKTGILIGSLIAGTAGYCWLRFSCPPYDNTMKSKH